MIRKTKVYLRGAYGPGNLGDDVLMLVMIRILKSTYQAKDIAVTVKDIAAGRAMDPEVNWVPLNAPVFSQVTVLGGGGQFFSFEKHRSSNNKKQSLIRSISTKLKEGYTLMDLVVGYLLRKFHNNGYYSKNIATFCIGVGPFMNGKDKQYTLAYNLLNKASFISVRDEVSRTNVWEISKKQAHLNADLTLKRELWLEDEKLLKPPCKPSKKPVIGVVFREWSLNEQGANLVQDLLNFEKMNNQYDYVYISLYEKYDQQVITSISDRDLMIWRPQECSVSDFLLQLKSRCDAIVSCRAHGVLLSTMVYIPTVALGIEPKLKAFHRMLPNSTKYLEANELSLLDEYIHEVISQNHSLNERVNSDLYEISPEVDKGVGLLSNWLNEYDKAGK